MREFFDSFWRAIAYCVHPRVIFLSFLPLLVTLAVALVLGYFFWTPAVDGVTQWLQSSSLVASVADWLGGAGLGTVVAPLIVVALAMPAIVLVCLLVVAVLMTPAIVKLVADRRFPQLERRHGGTTLASIAWSLGSTAVAIVALVITLPLWLIPPLVLVLPALIWGWLTYRVMTFDALAEHATREERKLLVRRHRTPLLAIGIATGLLGAAPSVVWASTVVFAAAFVVLVPVAIWIYTLVFAFSSLWFAHYCLAALERLRAQQASRGPVALVDAPTP